MLGVRLLWCGSAKRRSSARRTDGRGSRRSRRRRPWCIGAAKGLAKEGEGQATLEYLLVLFGVVFMLVALYALVRAGESGVLANLATRCASHALGRESYSEGLLDAFMY